MYISSSHQKNTQAPLRRLQLPHVKSPHQTATIHPTTASALCTSTPNSLFSRMMLLYLRSHERWIMHRECRHSPAILTASCISHLLRLRVAFVTEAPFPCALFLYRCFGPPKFARAVAYKTMHKIYHNSAGFDSRVENTDQVDGIYIFKKNLNQLVEKRAPRAERFAVLQCCCKSGFDLVIDGAAAARTR